MISVSFLLLAASWEPMDITAEAMPLAGPEGTELGCTVMTSAHILSGSESFGGYSGMVFDAETGDLLLLADRGRILSTSVWLDETGTVTGVGPAKELPILDQNGKPLVKRNGDTEALAPWPGGYLMTREGLDDALLIAQSEDAFSIIETIADLSGGEALRRNGGYEAATSLSDERALFISEGTLSSGEAMITFFDGENVMDRGLYEPAEDFAVTDIIADEATDRLFVVERAFSRALGPRARITGLPLSIAIDDDLSTVRPAELARLTLEHGVDNMEGIAFYGSSDGGENLMLISDDNFNAVQRTVLMTFRLGQTCPL